MTNPRPAQVAEGSARAAIERARAIHVKARRKSSASGWWLRVLQAATHDDLADADEWCHHCRVEWPCPTIVALDPTPTHRPARATTPQEGHQ
jgi:hypothetical protein